METDRTFVTVWAILLGLTAILAVAGKLFHENLAVAALLTVTPLKAGLVLYYFMHLRREGTLLRGMVLLTLVTLLIFIGFLFFDLAGR